MESWVTAEPGKAASKRRGNGQGLAPIADLSNYPPVRRRSASAMDAAGGSAVTLERPRLIARLANSVRTRLLTSPLLNRTAQQELRCDRSGRHAVSAPLDHLHAALDWLERAHDGTPDAGVSRGYSLAWNSYFGGRGWQASYPETTGYIIPTLFEAAHCLDRPTLAERAIRMADWEIEVQLASGAVQGGIIGERVPPTPAIFNTGQVILGWVSAHRETGRDEYVTAAKRAADYLLDAQAPDGSFDKGHSDFARKDCTTYYTRVAWPLCLLGSYIDEARYVEAGRRATDHGLSRQLPNGWFRENCLGDPDRPLLHTIAYAMRGVLEVGLLLKREEYVDAARRTAEGLAGAQRAAGGLAGRLASDWSEATEWECLTGNAQTAIVWWKLGGVLGDAPLRDRARSICEFTMSTQNLRSADPGLRGGIKGSYPIDGEYGRFELLNWAAKFFVDAMLLTATPGTLRRPAEVTS